MTKRVNSIFYFCRVEIHKVKKRRIINGKNSLQCTIIDEDDNDDDDDVYIWGEVNIVHIIILFF